MEKLDFDEAKDAALSCFHTTVNFKLNMIGYWFSGGRGPQDDAGVADFQAKMAPMYGTLAQVFDRASQEMPRNLLESLVVAGVPDDLPLPMLGKKSFLTWHEAAKECVWELLAIPILAVDATDTTFQNVGGEDGYGSLEKVIRDLPGCPLTRPFWERVVEESRGRFPRDNIEVLITREWANAVAREREQPSDGGKADDNLYAGKNVDTRMLAKITTDPDCRGWTCTQWKQFLKCSKPSVVAAKTWKMLKEHRDTLAAERAKDRFRR